MATIEQLEQRVLSLEQKLTASILDDDPYQSPHTGPEIDAAIDRAKAGGDIDITLQNKLGGVESADHPGCYYRMVGSVVEWFNPPMELGDEYRTTERYLGKPVYVKVVDCGNLPASGLKNIAHGIANCKPIHVYGEMSNGNTLPYTTGTYFYISADGDYIQIYVTGNLSGQTAKATIKYTKTTD